MFITKANYIINEAWQVIHAAERNIHVQYNPNFNANLAALVASCYDDGPDPCQLCSHHSGRRRQGMIHCCQADQKS